MAIHDLVQAVQSLFPPLGKIPEPESGAPSRASDDAEGGAIELPPVSRSPLPKGIEPGKGIPFPADGVLVLEEALRSVSQSPPPAIDVLAYYLPFHFYADKWGIYVRASGILSVAFMLASASGRALSNDLLNLAASILVQHERFHFFSEIACSRAELVLPDELYRHYFHDRRATAIEEALCNAYVLRTVLRGRPTDVRDQVEQWMLTQGPGYAAFRKCLSSSAFARWCQVATNKMCCSSRGVLVSSSGIRAGGVTLTRKHPSQRYAPAPTEFLFAGLARSTAPTLLVRDAPSVGVLRPFPKYAGMRILVHTHDHPPPHIHVEVPPGRDLTRLTWPTLEPIPGDSPLSRQQRTSLDDYLAKYGEEIDQKVRKVYSPR